MRGKRMLALVMLLAILPVHARAQENALRDAELRRAQLFGLIQVEEADPSRTVTPREGLGMVADALALSLGARDASFDNLAQSADDQGVLKMRELCMALSRAGARMGVPVRGDLEEPGSLSGTIGRSSYFATRDAAYQAPNGKTYENELLYAVAFACGTPSMTTEMTLIDPARLMNQGLEAGASWDQTVAAALRLYEAVPQVDPQADQTAKDSALPESTPDAPQPQQTPAAETAETPKIAWIEVTVPLVNIRSGASLENAVLSQASQGERYQTFGRTEEGWYIIEYEENAIGYISSAYCKQVQPSKTGEGDVIGTVTVLAVSSFVRAQPANSGAAVFTASRGQSFECLGQEGNGWYKIRYDGDEIGYIYHKNCALSWFS